MSKQLELGALLLALPNHNLQLSLHATATFAYPHHSPNLSSHPEIKDLSWEIVRQSWVCRGSGLTLKFGIRIDGAPIAEAHLRNLEDVICYAELWSQLGLAASTKVDVVVGANPSQRNGQLCFALSHAHSMERLRTDRIHRICYDISPSDVMPPGQVCVLELMEIQLSMDIRTQMNMADQISLDITHTQDSEMNKTWVREKKRKTNREAAVAEAVLSSHNNFSQHITFRSNTENLDNCLHSRISSPEESSWRWSDSGYSSLQGSQVNVEKDELMLHDLPDKEATVDDFNIETFPFQDLPSIDTCQMLLQESEATSREVFLTNDDYGTWIPGNKLGWLKRSLQQVHEDTPDPSYNYTLWLRYSKKKWASKMQQRRKRRRFFAVWNNRYADAAMHSTSRKRRERTASNITLDSTLEPDAAVTSFLFHPKHESKFAAKIVPRQQAIHQNMLDVDFDLIAGLVDASLRLSIDERPCKLIPGVEIMHTDFKQRLVDVAPALWSVGYLQALSAHASLLPTISHVFSQSLYINAQSPALKIKLARLLSSSPNNSDGNASDMEPAKERAMNDVLRFDVISATLWKHMQQRLLEQRVKHRLKPLTPERCQLFHDCADIFYVSPEQEFEDDFMLDDEGEDIWAEDDASFEREEVLQWFENDDDMFEGEGWEYDSEQNLCIGDEQEEAPRQEQFSLYTSGRSEHIPGDMFSDNILVG